MANTSFQELINGDTPVLIDFYATWCGPCKAYSPILQQLKEDMGDSMRLIKIDVDRNPEITQKLRRTVYAYHHDLPAGRAEISRRRACRVRRRSRMNWQS